ncbi:MAG: hypothetical protein QM572_03825 [Nocardioides sp.]|uniref:hypothetical protein n=1 Tax=Nocardioides sp. TaxID=35761 RepID=UPI0039E234A5
MSTITFRADAVTEQALLGLVSDGIDRSTAIRDAILAAFEAKQRARLREESQRIANDPADRAEIAAIQAEMADLAPDDAW